MQAYGNLINRIAESANAEMPKVGDGATLYLYSDRSAYTVTRVEGKKLWATKDKAIRTDNNGMSDSQEYRYETDPDATEELFTLRKDNRWHRGTSMKNSVLNIGFRDAYHDFSF